MKNLVKIIFVFLVLIFCRYIYSQNINPKNDDVDPEVKQIRNDLDKISSKNKIWDEMLKEKLRELNGEYEKLVLENKLLLEKNKKEMADISRKLEKLKLENSLKDEEIKSLSMEYNREKNKIEMEMKRMEFSERKLKYENAILQAKLEKMKYELEIRDKKEDWKKQSNTEPIYKENPFNEKEKEIIISDRRIALNGPIVRETADYVTERIHYFNNISTQPIFIVIDNSPGGSVMSGYRILKAMEASKAPVYVVVKSFAASMAAIITTLAKKSFVYPNAVMLHHQMSTMNWGNMTQLKEQLEWAREWERRLASPVAKKMNMTLEEFRKKMYEKNSDGDWHEFGDKAVEYKWADFVVERIEETGFIKNPDAKQEDKSKGKTQVWEEKVDEKGQRYIELPRLEPFDFYFIYNPDRYYR